MGEFDNNVNSQQDDKNDTQREFNSNPYSQNSYDPNGYNQYSQQNYNYQNQGYQSYQQQPYQQQYYQNNYYQPYQQPYGYYYQQPKQQGKAIASMVLGIISIVTFFFPLAIAGLIFGIMSKKSNEDAKGMSTAGIITSIICLALTLLLIVGFIAAFAFFDDTSSYNYEYGYNYQAVYIID